MGKMSGRAITHSEYQSKMMIWIACHPLDVESMVARRDRLQFYCYFTDSAKHSQVDTILSDVVFEPFW